MKLDNKADKKIKRFLKSVSEDYIKSKIYESIHYFISVNGVLKDFRFSDHISKRNSNNKVYLDIMKMSEDVYVIIYKKDVLQLKASAENVFEIVKGFVYLEDYIEQSLIDLREYARNLNSQLDKLKNKYRDYDNIKNKVDNLSKGINTLNKKNSAHLTTIKGYQKEIQSLKDISNNRKTKNNNLQIEISKLKKENEQLKTINKELSSKRDKLKNIIQKIINKWKR